MPQTEKLSNKDRADLAKISSMLPKGDSRIQRINAFLTADAQQNLPEGVKVAGINPHNGQPLLAPADTEQPSYWKALTDPVGSGYRQQSIGGGALQVSGQATKTLLQPFAHPIDTLTGLAKTGAYAMGQGMGVPMPDEWNPARPMVENFIADKEKGGLPLALENLAGQAIGTVEGGRALGGAIEAAKPVTAAAGRGLQTLAAKNLDRIYPQPDSLMLRGDSGGRGILQSGIGPTLSRTSMVRKVAGASDTVGSRLGDVIQRAQANANAPRIPASAVSGAIERPLAKATAQVEGFGGAGNVQPIETLRSTLTQPAPGASVSIYGPNAPAEIQPMDLWDSIRNLDRNTNFTSDPALETANQVRRNIRGGLRPLLESVDPTIRPLSSQYSDLQAARIGLERAGGNGRLPFPGVRSMVRSMADSTPLNSTASAGAYRLGGALRRFGEPASGAPPAPFAPKLVPKPLQLESSVPGNAEYQMGGKVEAEPEFIPPARKPNAIRLPAENPPAAVEPPEPTQVHIYPAGSAFRNVQETSYYPAGSAFRPKAQPNPFDLNEYLKEIGGQQ